MNSDIKKLAEWAVSQGWQHEDDSNGHTRFFDPAGNYIADYPCTPSSKRRLTRFVSALKAAGLRWPPPSKCELRSERRKGKL